ncbi:MAG: 4Fe-4S cluster-binding domain-containing protein [Oscillospiraceae bacterium]|nr:4Fe-4S cluster-binding domain-containing protein [Oscillospiraceae bacterium]
MSDIFYSHRCVIFDALEDKLNLFKLYENPLYEKITEEYIKLENSFKQGDISVNTIESVDYPFAVDDIIKGLGDSLRHLSLCVTQDCNLRCDYCTYSGHYLYSRKHSKKSMAYDIAVKAIDFYCAHSTKCDKSIVSFYGGEPLIEFEKIKKLVSYCQNIFGGKEQLYLISSNGTLLNDEFMNWFIENPDVQISITLSGPEDCHDRYRHTSGGSGSHRLIMDFITSITKRNPEAYHSRVNFLCNYLNLSDVYDIMRFHETEKILQGKTPVFISRIKDSDHDGFVSALRNKRADKGRTFSDKAVYDELVEMFCDEKGNGNPILKRLFDHSLFPIHQRQMHPVGEKAYFTGICAPFLQRLFVNTDGQFNLCEKAGDYCDYGDVHNGFNIAKIKKFLFDYKNANEEKCASCWAVRFCPLCFIDVFTSDVIDTGRRDRLCNNVKKSLTLNLSLYCGMMEKSPSGLDYLDNYTFDF